AFAGRETLQPAVIAHGDRRPEGTIPPAEADHLVVRRPIREGDPHTGTRTDFSLNNQVLACWALARSRVNFSSDEPRNWCVSSDEPGPEALARGLQRRTADRRLRSLQRRHCCALAHARGVLGARALEFRGGEQGSGAVG